jgi:putative ATP-dependent endonuclease of the OLD family
LIDEPELHLHPKWQLLLLSLFESLAEVTGNQFILATHSPVFVAPASIQYVSRVFNTSGQSAVVKLDDTALPDKNHLFSIVNSQNNERIFFADKVILVEGATDRIFFEAVFERLDISAGASTIYEVVDVGGKSFFGPYKALLGACKIPYTIHR